MNQLGNTVLVNYGIQNWKCDYMIHICPLVKRAYVYPTTKGREAEESGYYPLVSVWTGSIETARGYIVPPESIRECRWFEIPQEILSFSGIAETGLTTSEKGKRAVFIAECMINRGMIPLPARAEIIHDLDDQIQGLDVVVSNNNTCQIKCDYKGGHFELGGTGNLFLQTKECNPNKLK